MEGRASAVRASPLPLDPAAARQAKAQRLKRFHTVRAPRLRLVGHLVFVTFAWAHNLIILDDPSLKVPLLVVTAATVAYVMITWILLVACYDRVRWLNLGDLFLATDGLVALATIWATGGDQSLLFFYMILRAADQSAISSSRTFFFAAASAILYLALMVGLELLPGREIDWPVVLVKLGFIAGLNFYLVGVAGAADRYRRRTSEAVRLTRSLVADLERKSAQLEQEQVRARAANLAKSQFLANMSHEIRTPMSAIIGLNRLQRKTELPEDAAIFADKIEESADDLLRLIDDILDLSRVEANKLQVEKVGFRLKELLEHAIEVSRPRSEAKDVRLVLESQPDLPVWVQGDPARIQQVLLNLVSNAIKFTDQGAVRLHVERGLLEDVCFQVRDTGIGIDAAMQRNLFEPFFQGDASTTRRFGGTGLGLAISRRLVQLMGGTLDFESTVGVGSTFTVRLPLPAAQPQEEAHQDNRGIEPVIPLPSDARILVADDNDVNRLVLRLQLEGMGLQVDAVSDGTRALEALGLRAYDLLLLDCQMPDLDGYEVAQRMRSNPSLSRIPIVAVTAHAMRGARKRCLAAGMDDYLAKPFRENELAEMIARWLSGRSISAAPPTLAHAAAPDPGPSPAGSPILDDLKIASIEKLGHDLLAKVMEEFLNSAPQRIVELGEHLASGDTASAARVTHTLVGTTGMTGASRLSASCARVHDLVEAGDLESAHALMAQVRTDLEQTCVALRGLIARDRSSLPSGRDRLEPLPLVARKKAARADENAKGAGTAADPD